MPEGWWYQGGGIYRHVWLNVTERLCVDLWGCYVHPEKTPEGWNVPVETTVRNDTAAARTAAVISTVIAPTGETVAEAQADVTVPPYGKATAASACFVSAPLLWDIDTPNLYTLKSRVIENGAEFDEHDTPFGFREAVFDANRGFFLNGHPVKLKGVCCHQDFGLTGLVLPDNVAGYRLKKLQEMGANAYRSAHNMSDEATMNYCDRHGILVFDETRYFSTAEEQLHQLRQMVLRDRNRPSVICWSIGNEEISLQHTETGRRQAERMHAMIKTLDATRPTSMAVAGYTDPKDETKLLSAGPLDLLCYNYAFHLHDALHARFAEKPFAVTESCALQTTRGHFYGDDLTAGYYMGYDHDYSNGKLPYRFLRSESWANTAEKPYIAGVFVWAGIEHRGETAWPRLCSQSGLLDLYLQKKDAYYQTKSQYCSEPMVHLVPSSWNFDGLEGLPMKVVVFTNCDEVELRLNGKNLGKQVTPPHFENPEWQVPYESGRLEAIGYRNGQPVCRDEQKTTGKPDALQLRLDTTELSPGDTALFTCFCTDAAGAFVPDADPTVFFTTAGGTLTGTGSDISDHVPPRNSRRRMRMGLITVAVQVPEEADSMTLFAEGNGLRKAYCHVSVSQSRCIAEKQMR